MMMMAMMMIVSVPVAVCVLFQCDEYPSPRWLALHETERVNTLNQREASAASLRLPTKVIVSRKGDRTGNEFNISSADSCNLIVVPVKQIQHFQRGGDGGSILMALL